MFDEACLIAVEINNQINEEKKKHKEKQKNKDAQFQKDMAELFQKEEGEM